MDPLSAILMAANAAWGVRRKVGEAIQIAHEAESILKGVCDAGQRSQLEERLVTAAEKQAEALRMQAEAVTNIAGSINQVISLFLVVARNLRQGSSHLNDLFDQAAAHGVSSDLLDHLRKRVHVDD